MGYQCPKGHMSSDPDYCSECGAKIGQPSAPPASPVGGSAASNPVRADICPDCGTPRVQNARFCEVCRYDFTEGKTGTAEKVVAASQPETVPEPPKVEVKKEAETPQSSPSVAPSNAGSQAAPAVKGSNTVAKDELVIAEKLNIIISVDKNRVAQNEGETNIKPDSVDRIFPLDLDENLVGRRSVSRGIYPEIEINDPGVSHRHLKFIKQSDGAFAALELGSANGTEYNGTQLASGVITPIKAGDEFALGLWTILKVVAR